MLDTNTASYLVGNRSAAVRRSYLAAEPDARMTLSVITEAEICFGLEKKPEALRLRNEFDLFFRTIEVLPWTSEAAMSYARIRAGLSAAGKSLARRIC